MKSAATLVALALLLAACAAPPPPLGTSSGRPEVFLADTTKKQVMDRIVAAGLARGLQVRNVSEYGLVLARKADGVGAAILYGSRYDSTPELRVHFNMVDAPGGVQVYGRGEIVTNPGSAFERVTDLTQSEGQSLQSMLMDLQRVTARTSTAAQSSAPSSTPAQPYTQQQPDAPVVRTATGADTLQAAKLARDQSCAVTPQPLLIAKGPGFETYSVACANSDTMMIRCEYGNCRPLR